MRILKTMYYVFKENKDVSTTLLLYYDNEASSCYEELTWYPCSFSIVQTPNALGQEFQESTTEDIIKEPRRNGISVGKALRRGMKLSLLGRTI